VGVLATREPWLVRDGPGPRQFLDPMIEVGQLQIVSAHDRLAEPTEEFEVRHLHHDGMSLSLVA
jgi:hypothetical protein